MSAQMAADFRRAAEIIAEGGLAKGIFEDRQGRHCAVGALVAAVDPDVASGHYMEHSYKAMPHVRELAEEIGPQDDFSPPMGQIVTWNDREQVTATHVQNVLHKVADRLEASEVSAP